PETKKIIRYYLRPLKQKRVDTLLLACTHYPLLYKEITAAMGKQTQVAHPGKIVAKKLVEYLARHPEIETRLRKEGVRRFLTTDRVEDFERFGSKFLGEKVKAGVVI
ncbi:MAG: glutamate racemase, partial [Patescibacteria group bacterium]